MNFAHIYIYIHLCTSHVRFFLIPYTPIIMTSMCFMISCRNTFSGVDFRVDWHGTFLPDTPSAWHVLPNCLHKYSLVGVKLALPIEPHPPPHYALHQCARP